MFTYVDNLREDVAVGDSAVTSGTKVTVGILDATTHTLVEVFNAYTSDYAFGRTHIHVELFRRGSTFVSRSAAKRILSDLASFSEIVFDYKSVRLIGQGFADQIYRVYQKRNPGKKLISINASPNIAAMIRRAGGTV